MQLDLIQIQVAELSNLGLRVLLQQLPIAVNSSVFISSPYIFNQNMIITCGLREVATKKALLAPLLFRRLNLVFEELAPNLQRFELIQRNLSEDHKHFLVISESFKDYPDHDGLRND